MAWWTVLALLVMATLLAWRFEARFSRLQNDQLYRLGEDITSNQEKWKSATIGHQGAFFWWKDLDVGHRSTRQSATLKEIGLLSMVLQLGITLAVVTRRCCSSRAQPDARAEGGGT